MQRIHIHTLFDKRTHKPCCTGILIGKNLVVKELFRPGAGKPLFVIFETIKFIRDLIVSAHKRNIPIVISDFKAHLKAFDLPLCKERYDVYDLHLPAIDPSESAAKDTKVLEVVLRNMAEQETKRYQKIFANAAVVYEDLERHGLVYNYKLVHPIYSQRTYSGRSKTMGFNIQGLGEPSLVHPANYSENDLLLHFDWVCADIRAASLLSKDAKLAQSFVDSDPYTAMMYEINAGSDQQLTRNECKQFLLQSINSMNFASEALANVYPGLGRWIRHIQRRLREEDGYTETILQRRFPLKDAKNMLAALNAAMQGSVAHAMQSVIRQIWEKLGVRLITEIHDSLVMACPPRAPYFEQIMDEVANIMLRPFGEDGPIFPVNVSVGKKWKKWRLCRTYRENGVHNVKKLTSKDRETPQAGTEAETPWCPTMAKTSASYTAIWRCPANCFYIR